MNDNTIGFRRARAEAPSAKEILLPLVKREIDGKPFSELFGVTMDHRSANVTGLALLSELSGCGYSLQDFDAVGALTAAAVPLVTSVVDAAAQMGYAVDGFVMDFVYPSIKGPSIAGKRVVLLDSWLSQKSYVQTSSLVTLRNGNELSLDFGIVTRAGASVVAVASLIGGLTEGTDGMGNADTRRGEGVVQTAHPVPQELESQVAQKIEVVDPVDGTRQSVPFVQVFDEHELQVDIAGPASGQSDVSSAAEVSHA